MQIKSANFSKCSTPNCYKRIKNATSKFIFKSSPNCTKAIYSLLLIKMKAFLIILLAVSACHCQLRCASQDDIAKILETPPRKQDLKYLVSAADKEAVLLNSTLSRYNPDEYPKDPTPIQCSAAVLANLFSDIDLHVDDDKWEISESTLQQYESLEKSMSASTNSRVKRGLFGFFKKVVKGIVKIAQTIAKVVQVIKQVVSFVLTVFAIIKDIKTIIGAFGK